MSKIMDLWDKLPAEFDSALITSDINRRYFTGMKSSAGTLVLFREKAYLLIDFRYIEKAKQTVKSCEVVLVTDFKEQFTTLCEENNAKLVAIESNNVTVEQFEGYYKKKFPNLTFDISNKLSSAIDELRTVKTDTEIQKIQIAQKIAEKAFDNVLNYIKVGKTEKEISFFLDSYMLQNGAEALSFETIALIGENSSLPHGVPSDRILKSGEFILMDYGAVYDGYHSDMTRTVCLGQPTDKMASVYNIVLDANVKALEAVKADMLGSELDAVARNIITDHGYGELFGHSLGHGVGMEVHESPSVSSKSETRLKENTIVTIEPGIYIPSEFGVRIEDFVIVKNNGCHNLTASPKNLICL